MTDYKKLVEALRCCENDLCRSCSYESGRDFRCINRMASDAAAAIEDMAKHITEMHERVTVLQIARGELEAEVKRLEPKRGEWIYHPKDAIEMMFTLPKCSICGHESSDALNYCPNCWAKMEVQDGE